jgi:hypothetical protein
MGVRALSAVPTAGARAVDPDVGLVEAAREQPRAFLALYDRYFERVLGYEFEFATTWRPART